MYSNCPPVQRDRDTVQWAVKSRCWWEEQRTKCADKNSPKCSCLQRVITNESKLRGRGTRGEGGGGAVKNEKINFSNSTNLLTNQESEPLIEAGYKRDGWWLRTTFIHRNHYIKLCATFLDFVCPKVIKSRKPHRGSRFFCTERAVSESNLNTKRASMFLMLNIFLPGLLFVYLCFYCLFLCKVWVRRFWEMPYQ